MPQVRITAGTVVNRLNVRAGDVVNVSEADARLLLRIGKAQALTATAGPAIPALLKPRARKQEAIAP